ncbi:polyprenyl synthetase family protein [Rhodococcus sp. H29-C3]|uniref:polyprenyl synthetase family protein n=1 Tax=Rhodococcus sp. H29-C3 TaxID=3046307 RepID=UPI0024BA059B|nr:polyprenyl synthetase family protein [Rhodococcus sp. H29-C3]MDJ0360976.1 polyprenyl synthetase family protein [Rhodococcus sp. H29-C3]
MTAPVALVESALAEFFHSRRDQVARVGGGYRSAVADLEAFVLRGGKRIRPSFGWMAWLGAGGDHRSPQAASVLRACASLELIQACALIHDDIIDASLTRRGFPTVHVGFTERHRAAGWSGSSERFGESAAILLGDLALCWADDMLRESGIGHDAMGRVSPVWSAMRTEVLGGQLLDIEAEAGLDESVEAAMQVNRYKTAAYTVERPLQLGAVLAGAPESLVDAYRSFGTDIGLAFQLRDDLLGVFGDPAVTGKPSGDDIREGKRTVLMAVALQLADRDRPEAGSLLRSSLGVVDLTEDTIATIRTLLIELGAVADVERRISELTDRALDTLKASAVEPHAAAQLRAMSIAATQRTY